MVRRGLAVSVLAGALFTACAVGEAPPRLTVLSAPDAGAGCADPRDILTTTNDARSRELLDCWRTSLNTVWTQVQGAAPGRFTDREVLVLLESRLIALPGSPKDWFARFLGAKDLLGISTDIQQRQVTSILDWLRDHRGTLRRLYRFAIRTSPEDGVTGATLGLNVATSFFRWLANDPAWDGQWGQTEDELVSAIARVFLTPGTVPPRRIRASVRVAREIVGTICDIPIERITARATATCLEQWDELARGSVEALRDYVLNPHGNPAEIEKAAQSALLRRALARIGELLPAARPGVSLATLDEFVDATSAIPRPVDVKPLADSRVWLSIWSGSEGRVSLARLREVALNFLDLWDAEVAGRCLDCTPAAGTPPSDVIATLRNQNFGEGLRPHAPSENRFLLLIHAFTQSLIPPFDRNRDGILTSDQGETATLVSGLVDAYLSWADFGARIQNQVAENPIPMHWRHRGLGDLLSLVGSEVAPRPPSDVVAFREFLFNFYHDVHPGGLILDRVGLSAVFGWLSELVLTSRSPIADFPRTRAACASRGNCAALDQALAILNETVRALTLATLESAFDACDANASGAFELTEWSDAEDEGGCLVKKMRAILLSLMDSDVLRDDPEVRDLLNDLHTNVFKTMGAKVALARGTREDLALHVIFPPSDRTIRRGAVLSLLVEVIRGE